MDDLINALGPDRFFIMIAMMLTVPVGLVVFILVVRARKRRQHLPQVSATPRVPPYRIQEGTESIVLKETSEGAELEVAIELAGDSGGEVPSERVATPAEIQRSEPKPLASALSNTRSSFFGRLQKIFGTKSALSAGELDEVEEILFTSDLGPQTVQRLLDAVQTKLKADGGSGFEVVRLALKSQMLEIFSTLETDSQKKSEVRHGSETYLEGLEPLDIWNHKPAVIMVVGVNGAGKTTTIGKLSRRIAQSGRRVLVAAGDTFRAAAGDQLKVWTERAQVEIFSPEGVSEPSAVAFKACEHALQGGFDVVIIDTAGRLHTQKNLMEELKKMKRVITKPLPTAPHEVLLVLDANSGQNALIQAREFHQAVGVTGVVLTKLDGSAKGGVAVGLACELCLPIKLIGVGEGIDDLRGFHPDEFVDSII
jgi:fused signal recognition particle receptor